MTMLHTAMSSCSIYTWSLAGCGSCIDISLCLDTLLLLFGRVKLNSIMLGLSTSTRRSGGLHRRARLIKAE